MDGSIQIGELRIETGQMDLRLDGCIAKLDRAAEHLQAIDDEIANFFKTNPYTVSGQIDPKTGWYVFRLNKPPQPLRAGVLVGECVHQLRSILDHLVAEIDRWYFAQKRPGLPRSGRRFLVEASPKKFEEKKGRLIGSLPEDWQDIIKQLQPSDSGHAGHFDWLEHVWNTDKHASVYKIPPAEFVRPIVKPGLRQQVFFPIRDVTSGGEWHLSLKERLEVDAEIARIKVEPSGSDPRVDMNCEIEVAIPVDEVSGLLLGDTLFRAGIVITGMLGMFPTGPVLEEHPIYSKTISCCGDTPQASSPPKTSPVPGLSCNLFSRLVAPWDSCLVDRRTPVRVEHMFP